MVKNRDGFTIVEILISIGVFAIAVPVVALGIRNLIAINNRSRDLALVNIIASNKAEQLRNSGYNGLTVGTTDFSDELPSEISSPKTASYTTSFPETGTAQITIAISYRDYNQTRNLTYRTLVTELGVGQ